jgi:hypothetical protein
MKATTVSSSYTTLASACRATMAQKMHPCAADVAFCVMRAMVPVRPDRCYSVASQVVARLLARRESVGGHVSRICWRITCGGCDAALSSWDLVAGLPGGLRAVRNGVCVRPVLSRMTDTSTGEQTVVPIPCGSTQERQCPPCADRARKLRMQQCREGSGRR